MTRTPYEDTDKNYVGPVNAEGLEWHGDLECYIPDDWDCGLSVHIINGKKEVWHVLMGKPQIILTEREWKFYRDEFGDNKGMLAEYLLANFKNPEWTEEDQEDLEWRNENL